MEGACPEASLASSTTQDLNVIHISIFNILCRIAGYSRLGDDVKRCTDRKVRPQKDRRGLQTYSGLTQCNHLFLQRQSKSLSKICY